MISPTSKDPTLIKGHRDSELRVPWCCCSLKPQVHPNALILWETVRAAVRLHKRDQFGLESSAHTADFYI